MKIRSTIVLLLLAFSAVPAHASMMYYTLEGVVMDTFDPYAITDVQVGDSMFGTFGVDMTRLGLEFQVGDAAPREIAGTYYTTYVGGNLGWSDNRPDMQDNWVQGGEWDDPAGLGYFSEFHHGLTVMVFFDDLDFEVGQVMLGEYYVGSPYEYYAMFQAALTVTDISTKNPYSSTPIPAAVWLLVPGLVGVLGAKRRSQLKS